MYLVKVAIYDKSEPAKLSFVFRTMDQLCDFLKMGKINLDNSFLIIEELIDGNEMIEKNVTII